MQEAHRRLLEQIKEEKEKKKLRYIEKQVKKEGGLVYKGAKSFLIAKENSQNQEENKEDESSHG